MPSMTFSEVVFKKRPNVFQILPQKEAKTVVDSKMLCQSLRNHTYSWPPSLEKNEIIGLVIKSINFFLLKNLIFKYTFVLSCCIPHSSVLKN